MLFRLLLLFIVVPLVELMLLLKLAEVTSGLTTFLIVILTGLVGTALARTQGLRAFRRIRDELSAGRMPTDSLVDALMILVAGALLVTPGLLTDAFGLSLLVPFCRQWYRRWIKAWFQQRIQFAHFTTEATGSPGKSEVIDSYVVDRDPGPE